MNRFRLLSITTILIPILMGCATSKEAYTIRHVVAAEQKALLMQAANEVDAFAQEAVNDRASQAFAQARLEFDRDYAKAKELESFDAAAKITARYFEATEKIRADAKEEARIRALYGAKFRQGASAISAVNTMADTEGEAFQQAINSIPARLIGEDFSGLIDLLERSNRPDPIK